MEFRLGDANEWWLEIKPQEQFENDLAIQLVDLSNEVDCASRVDTQRLVCA